ncbi:MAG: DUF1566 domain-containing protein [Minisyncoccia bacterium]
MNKILKIVPYLVIAILVGVTVSYAGSLTPPGAPAQSMYKLSDLYELINTGTNTPDTTFTTPGTISATMNSIGDIYDLMVSKIDDIDGTQILTGTTIFGVGGSASAGGLPKTNQTLCYNAAGATITCTDGDTALGGQDGYYQKGIAPAYVDNSNGTISDGATGLMWKKCSEGKTGVSCETGADTTKTWTEALAVCEADTTGGYTDWRLPNIRELLSIVDYGTAEPAINSLFNSQSDYYWSSTTYLYPGFQNFAWNVGFHDGYANGDDKTDSDFVRCVR